MQNFHLLPQPRYLCAQNDPHKKFSNHKNLSKNLDNEPDSLWKAFNAHINQAGEVVVTVDEHSDYDHDFGKPRIMTVVSWDHDLADDRRVTLAQKTLHQELL